MQASEIMLGNWVQYGNNPEWIPEIIGTPVQVTIDEFIAIDGDETNKYEPIPLTPEILEAAGFRKLPRRNTWVKKDGSVSIELDKDGIAFIPFIKQEDGISEYSHSVLLSIEITHLHQLQNLYFSLIGHPLQISLTKLNSNI